MKRIERGARGRRKVKERRKTRGHPRSHIVQLCPCGSLISLLANLSVHDI